MCGSCPTLAGFAPSYSGVVPAPHPSDGLYWLGLRHGRMGRPGLSHARRLRRAWRLGSQQGAESVWSPGEMDLWEGAMEEVFGAQTTRLFSESMGLEGRFFTQGNG